MTIEAAQLNREQIEFVRDNIARRPGETKIWDITLALACEVAAFDMPLEQRLPALERIAAAYNTAVGRVP